MYIGGILCASLYFQTQKCFYKCPRENQRSYVWWNVRLMGTTGFALTL